MADIYSQGNDISSTYQVKKNYYVKIMGELVDITDDRLPTKGDILKAHFYRMFVLNMSEIESLEKTVKKCIRIWTEGQIPVLSLDECIKKFYLLYGEWQILELQYNRKNYEEYELIETMFLDSLDEPFDISDFEVLTKFRPCTFSDFEKKIEEKIEDGKWHDPANVKMELVPLKDEPIDVEYETTSGNKLSTMEKKFNELDIACYSMEID